MAEDLIEKDLTCEIWREYVYGGQTYRIDAPLKLITRPGGTTHRVLTGDGVVHCVPAPGHNGCALRWKAKDETKPVSF